ncbi:MAG: dihydroorotate dehydrogenase electron transfer subunit [Ignavibacteriales bacterium CG07_land_8_20_14_0_80_59_12]|nr:MAG: dihydroorotate dehydrogenase electron transfer subunit [Ignavibacteriales bacterium CG07_land_8_20_14_0_80_59_12]
MPRFQLTARAVRRQVLNSQAVIIGLEAAEIAASAIPGQFVELKVPGVLWRRPMSIYRRIGDVIEILVAIVGPGSRALAQLIPGGSIDIIGPLGNGFPIDGSDGDVVDDVVVAGGFGIAPFPFLVQRLREVGRTPRIFLGGRTKDQLFRQDLPAERISVATEDGSAGEQGKVVPLFASFADAVPERIERMRVYACGPTPMLRALQHAVASRGIRAWVSVEREMACGIGICQGCVVGAAGSDAYLLACKDGPVFDASAIVL